MKSKVKQVFTHENKFGVFNAIVEVGEGRTIDAEILQQIKDKVLSSFEISVGEKEYFQNALVHPNIDTLEDWQLLKFISIGEKAGVKIVLTGKPQLNVQSTIESQQELIKKIRECYKKESFAKLRPVLEDNKIARDISEAYVNLAIVMKEKSEGINSKANEELYQDFRMKSSYEQIYGKKEDFPVALLFSPITKAEKQNNQENEWRNNKLLSRILIEGWAGIGKTVLCQYLTVMWARDVKEKEQRWWLDDTQVVLWMRLRNLTKYDPKNCCIGEVIRRECFGVKDSKDAHYPSAIQIEADLAALDNKVVFILDGFDEVAEWYEECVDDSFQTLTARSELLTNELLGKRHNHCIILTSRATRIGKIKGDFDRRLETIGFKDSDINRYVHTFFKNDEEISQSLLDNMRKNRNLWGVAHIPLNLSLICLVSQQNKDKSEIFEAMTMTDIYNKTVLWLLRRDWEKRPIWNNEGEESRWKRLGEFGGEAKKGKRVEEKNTQKEARELTWIDFESKLKPYSVKLMFLEELAWRAQASKMHNLLISGKDVIECLQQYENNPLKNFELLELLSEIKSLGILECQYPEEDVFVIQNYFYFQHLTFQEYFAAKYWTKKYCSDNQSERKEAENLFRQYKYDSRFEVMWWFVSGLLSQNSPHFTKSFFHLIQLEPREFVGLKHITLLIRCLEESGFALNESQDVRNIIIEIKDWIFWSFDHCFHGKVSLSILYDSLNQSPTLFSHPIIVKALINHFDKKLSIKDYPIINFFEYVQPIHIDIVNLLWLLLREYNSSTPVKVKSHFFESISTDHRYDNNSKPLLWSIYRIIKKLNTKISTQELEVFLEYFEKLNLEKDNDMPEVIIAILPYLPWSKVSVEKTGHILRQIMDNRLFWSEKRHIYRKSDQKVASLSLLLDCLLVDKMQCVFDVVITIINKSDVKQLDLLSEIISVIPCGRFNNLMIEQIFQSHLKILEKNDLNVIKSIFKILPYLPWEKCPEDQFESLLNVILRFIESNRTDLDDNISVVPQLWNRCTGANFQKIFDCLLHLLNSSYSIKKEVIKILPRLNMYQCPSTNFETIIDLISNEYHEATTILPSLTWGAEYKALLVQKILGVIIPKLEYNNVVDSYIRVVSNLSWENCTKQQLEFLLSYLKKSLKHIDPIFRKYSIKCLYHVPWNLCSNKEIEELLESIVKSLSDEDLDVKSVTIDFLLFVPWNNCSDKLLKSLFIQSIECVTKENNIILKKIFSNIINRLWECFDQKQLAIIIEEIIAILKSSMNYDQSNIEWILPRLPWERLTDEQNNLLLDVTIEKMNSTNLETKRFAVTVLYRMQWTSNLTKRQQKLLDIGIQTFKDFSGYGSDDEEFLKVVPCKRCSDELITKLVKTIIDEFKNPDKEISWFIYRFLCNLPWEKFSDSSLHELVNFISSKFKQPSSYEANLIMSILSHVPWERCGVKQKQNVIEGIYHYLLEQNNVSLTNDTSESIKAMSWWELFNDETLYLTANVLFYAKIFLKICLYSGATMYIDIEKQSIVGRSVGGHEVCIISKALINTIKHYLPTLRENEQLPTMSILPDHTTNSFHRSLQSLFFNRVEGDKVQKDHCVIN